MKIIPFIASVLMVLAMPLVLMAQSPVALAKEIETSLKAKDHKRKLKDSIDDGRHIEQEWSIEGKKVLVAIYEYESPQEAKRIMEMERLTIEDSSGLEALPGLGDDAYVTGLRGGSAYLSLRRDNKYIGVDSRSRELAKKVGREIADFLAHRGATGH
jgi:hypothetical protein